MFLITFARSAKKFLRFCVFLGVNLQLFRAKRAENFKDLQGQIKVFGTFYARSAKKIFRVFKGKIWFLAPFRAKREKILGYPEGSQIGTPENFGGSPPRMGGGSPRDSFL